MRVVGIEPTFLSEPDFESGASTNSATPAWSRSAPMPLLADFQALVEPQSAPVRADRVREGVMGRRAPEPVDRHRFGRGGRRWTRPAPPWRPRRTRWSSRGPTALRRSRAGAASCARRAGGSHPLMRPAGPCHGTLVRRHRAVEHPVLDVARRALEKGPPRLGREVAAGDDAPGSSPRAFHPFPRARRPPAPQPSRLSNSPRPSSPPASASTAFSGWGIMPSTFKRSE